MQPDLFNPAQDAPAINKLQLIMNLRKAGIRNHNLLSAFEKVAREDYVAKIFRTRAYEDVALPIAAGQTINPPSIVAKMLDLLELNSQNITLEVGTGSGYQAAVISQLVRRLFTIEINRDLRDEAKARLVSYENVVSLLGNGCKGWADSAPYDRIIITGAMRAVSSELLEQLADGGVMIIPVGTANAPQKLLKITRNDNNFHKTIITEGLFDPLIEL